MSNRDKLSVFCFLLFFMNCSVKVADNKARLFLEKSETTIGKGEYRRIQNLLNDSIKSWILNRLPSVEAEFTYNYRLDSLICFNKGKDRFVGSIHNFGKEFNSTSDNLFWIYGEKIDKNWYFFKGATIVLPREMIPNQKINEPLTYYQMHELAIQELFAGYLDMQGEINDNFFTELFEGVQWGSMDEQEYLDWCFKGKRYTNKVEFYKAAHLCKVKANWMQRDTTQPIKQLPAEKPPIP